MGFSGCLECLLVSHWGYSSPTRSIGIKNLAGFFWQDIERKRVRSNILIRLGLDPLPLLFWAPGWAVLLPSGAGPPFRPEQKVKLDKTEAGRGGSFLACWLFGTDVGTARLKRKKLELGTGVVEIESQWRARKREQMGVAVGIGSQNPRPVAENATRAGHPRIEMRERVGQPPGDHERPGRGDRRHPRYRLAGAKKNTRAGPRIVFVLLS